MRPPARTAEPRQPGSRDRRAADVSAETRFSRLAVGLWLRVAGGRAAQAPAAQSGSVAPGGAAGREVLRPVPFITRTIQPISPITAKLNHWIA